MCSIRPWEGFGGMIEVMQIHLQDYVDTEEKWGHSESSYKVAKIATVKETIDVLERMKEPDNYSHRLRTEVERKYPEYMSLVSEYSDGSSSYSGDFVKQGVGWAGVEGGRKPHQGYFAFVSGRLELVSSPDQAETDRLIEEIHSYYWELTALHRQSELDSEKDFDHLAELLKQYLYSWWD